MGKEVFIIIPLLVFVGATFWFFTLDTFTIQDIGKYVLMLVVGLALLIVLVNNPNRKA